jgi:outer membrane lipoprotein-sorting protein
LLHEWARADDAIREARYRFKHTHKDKDADPGKVLRGEALFRRPGLLRVNVADDKGKPAVILFSDDEALYNYDFATRTERVFPLPPGGRRPAGPERAPAPFAAWVPEAAAWGFVGSPARQLPQRFDVRLAKEDRYYAYIELRPMAPADRKLFWRARVVLDRDGPWLRQLWFELPDGGEDFWDYEKPDPRPDPPITRELLTEGLPQGWERIDARALRRPRPQEPALERESKPEARLEAVLRGWAKASDAVREAHFTFTQTTKDKTFERTEVRRGEVFFKLPGLIRVNVADDKGRPTDVYLLAGRDLHLFDYKTRTERIIRLGGEFGPPEKPDKYPKTFPGRLGGQVLEQASWPILGLPVRQLRSRFDVRLAKEDQFYSYLDLTPRAPADKAELQRARVVLNRDGLWVRQFWVEQPTGCEVTWDFEKFDPHPDPPITRELILKGLKNLPPGWKRLDAPTRDQPPPPAPPK